MKKSKLLLFVVFHLMFVSSAVAQRWSCPISCSCPSNSVSVTCFGATPDDEIGDSAAIQSGISSIPDQWTLFFPAGVYVIDQPLHISRSNINLSGEGIQSELKTPRERNMEPFTLLSLPRREGYTTGCLPNGDYNYTPKNIVIEKLTFNGDFNHPVECPLDTDCGELNGIWILQGEDVTIRDVLVKEFSREGITIAIGSVPPKNITLRRVRTQRIRRTAIHFGLGENLSLEDSSIEDEGSGWGQFGSSVAIDVEVEGADIQCPAIPTNYHGGYVYNTTIKNSLIISPTSEESKGGIGFAAAQGPIRKALVQGNVVVNSTGITARGEPVPAASPFDNIRDPRVGTSRYIRELDISQNWVSNLHSFSLSFCSVQFVLCGDVADAYGPNDVRFNDNTMTFFHDSSGNRNVIFSGVRNLSGANNKTFRPNIVTPSGNPQYGHQNFLWDKNYTSVIPTNMQITNTLDNGWPGSRLACDDPSNLPQWYFCSISGKSNNITWVNNPNRTPELAPTITFATIWFPRLSVEVSEPNGQPVRLMIYRNGIPEGFKTVLSDTPTFIPLSSKPAREDTFELKAFNENGWHGEYSFTY